MCIYKFCYVTVFLIFLVYGKDIEELSADDAEISDTPVGKSAIINTNENVGKKIPDNLEIRFNEPIITLAKNHMVINSKRCIDNNNEEYIECGKKCVLTCKYDGENTNTRSSKRHQNICNKDNECVEGCFCKMGLVRHHGRCIRAEACPNRKCHKDEEYKCGPAISLTCDNYSIRNYLNTMNNKLECVWGCYCGAGYLRENNHGKCVAIKECNKLDILQVQVHVPGVPQIDDHDNDGGNNDNSHHEHPVKPNHPGQGPKHGHHRPPNYGQTRPPPYGPNRPPSNGQTRPPNYGQTRPPIYGQTRPPSYGQTRPPSYGENRPPSYGEDRPPSYGESRPPSYGENRPPSYGENRPPSYGGHIPPSYGENRPPSYGHNKPHSHGGHGHHNGNGNNNSGNDNDNNHGNGGDGVGGYGGCKGRRKSKRSSAIGSNKNEAYNAVEEYTLCIWPKARMNNEENI